MRRKEVIFVCVVAISAILAAAAAADAEIENAKKSEKIASEEELIDNDEEQEIPPSELPGKLSTDEEFVDAVEEQEITTTGLPKEKPSDEEIHDIDEEQEITTTESPKKEPVLTCASPPDVEGTIPPRSDAKEYRVGTRVTYSCNYGYVSRNSRNHVSTCSVNRTTGRAEWTVPEIACVPRSCGDPGSVNDGRRIGNLFTFPNKVEYECEEGYKLVGMKARYCQAGGEWSGRLPSCEPITCSIPPDLENAEVLYSSLEYGAELTYRCFIGFMETHHRTRYCEADGSWSDEAPECIEARCIKPISPEQGEVHLIGEPKVGSIATYSCNPGLKLQGASTTKCLITGQWTFGPPKCLSSCSVPPVENGKMSKLSVREISRWRKEETYTTIFEGEQVDHETTLSFRCNEDFAIVEDDKILRDVRINVTCFDGKWSRDLLCKQTSCLGEPPEMENGKAVVHGNTHGYSIWYRCDNPKDEKIPGKVTCHFGTWIGYTPQCLSRTPCYLEDLHFPGLVKPAQRQVKSQESFDIVCKQGYRLSTTARTITCKSGKWNVTEDPCPVASEAPCYLEDLRFPGLVKPSQRQIKSQESFDIVCKQGYRLSTTARTITCKSGKWNVTEDPCPEASEEPDQGRPVVVQPSQQPHVEEKSPSHSHNTDIQPPKQCHCTFVGAGLHVQANVGHRRLRDGDKVRQGKKVTFSCRGSGLLTWANGFRKYGNASVNCAECKRWEIADNPDCKVLERGGPFIILDDSIDVQPGGRIEVPVKKPIILICASSYHYPVWSFRGRPIQYETFTTQSGDTVHFFARIPINEIGYQDGGTYGCYINAAYNFKQTMVVVRVKEDECPLLAANKFVTYSNGNNVGSRATFSCPENTVLDGDQQIVCQNDGTWSAPEPRCTAIVCTYFPTAPGREVSYSDDNQVGSRAAFSCAEQTTLVGSAVSDCRSNGTWSSPGPRCINRTTCALFQQVYGLNINYSNGSSPGSNATFTCQSDADLNGNSYSVCLENGTWSHQAPSCEDKCSIGSLSTNVEKGVIPDMRAVTDEFVPFGSSVPLKCEGKFIPDGDSTAVCEEQGRWKIGIFECISGCDLNTDPSSHLQVQPLKDSYRFGETVTLSCPSGEKVTDNVQRLMCVGGWSDPIPDCIKA